MREEKVPLSLARDQMLGVETSLELTAQRANKAVGQRNRYRENALRLACENLVLRQGEVRRVLHQGAQARGRRLLGARRRVPRLRRHEWASTEFASAGT